MEKLLVHTISVVVLLALIACGNQKRRPDRIQVAERIMEQSPDSAYQLLCSVNAIDLQEKPVKMKFLLLKAEALNKLYRPMPSETVFQSVVSYYDDFGNANERMKVHYLLGCIYRDMGEAPKALDCFNDAVAQADTLSKDCDYLVMLSIYGQIADVFLKQENV